MFKLFSLKIYGINRRLITIPESIKLVKNYDLLCFTKTKTEDFDIIELDNNVLFAKGDRCVRESG